MKRTPPFIIWNIKVSMEFGNNVIQECSLSILSSNMNCLHFMPKYPNNALIESKDTQKNYE